MPFSSLLPRTVRGVAIYTRQPIGSNRRVQQSAERTIASLTNRDHLAIVRLVRLAEVYLLFLLRRTLLAKGGHSSFSSDNIHGDNTDGRKHSTDDDSRRNWHHKRRNMRADAFCG